MGWFKREKAFPKGVPALESSDKRQEFIDSIRWKGEIYCPRCAGPLERVPIDTHWFNHPVYDPMDARPLTWAERHGPTGLMVCSVWEKTRHALGLGYLYDHSFQGAFKEMKLPDHGMYYTDKPPLE